MLIVADAASLKAACEFVAEETLATGRLADKAYSRNLE